MPMNCWGEKGMYPMGKSRGNNGSPYPETETKGAEDCYPDDDCLDGWDRGRAVKIHRYVGKGREVLYIC